MICILLYFRHYYFGYNFNDYYQFVYHVQTAKATSTTTAVTILHCFYINNVFFTNYSYLFTYNFHLNRNSAGIPMLPLYHIIPLQQLFLFHKNINISHKILA